jgi:rhodanese-related sulfurtransferase
MRLVLSIFMLLTAFGLKAQIESAAFNLTLNALLARNVTEISVAELSKSDNVILLDAREEPEYKVSHLSNAIHIGYNNFSLVSVENIDKNARIVVYCSIGYRSEKITEKLKSAGFNHVSNLYGGIFEWVNQGNKVVDSNERETINVHAYNKTWGIWLNKGNKVYTP